MPEFRPFSLGEAARGAGAMFNLASAAEELKGRRTLKETARSVSAKSGRYDPEEHAKELEQRGYPMLADEIRTKFNQQIKASMDNRLKILEVIQKSADQVYDDLSYQRWKEGLYASKMANPGDLPDSYDDEAKEAIKKITVSTKDLLKLAKDRAGEGTALQKNVPFLAKLMGISRKEAAQILTTSREKGPEGFRQQVYLRALSQTFGDDEEAGEIANQAVKRFFPDYEPKEGTKEPDKDVRVYNEETGQFE
jgi:hypothetical protein